MPSESAFILAGLFVLLPILGWAYRHFVEKDDEERPPGVSADYMRGLNLVLNRRTDEALELFVQMAKVDDETLETHFALGHLFRRRGEVDRAIRVHQNILARPNLSESQRHQALYSLGEDYLSAGLFDRAEKLFSDLAESESHAKAALERLIYMFEQEKDWAKAVEARRKLEVLSGEKLPEVAHYYCELAEQARLDGDLALAKDYLKQTVRSAAGTLRGTLIKAAIAEEEQDFARAVGFYRNVLESDYRFIALVLPALQRSYLSMGKPAEFEAYVENLIRDDEGRIRDLAYAAIVSDLQDSAGLDRCVERYVMGNPVLGVLVNREELDRMQPADRLAAIRRIASGLQQLVLAGAQYRCTNCGFGAQQLLWHCPSCKHWESLRPIQNFQLESLVH